MDDRAVILILYVVFGLLAAALAIPLIRGKVPPNGFYGFRIPSTMKNPNLWYPVNAAFGRWLLVSGLTSAFAALLLHRSALSLDNYAWACLAAFAAPLIVGVVVGLRVVRDGR